MPHTVMITSATVLVAGSLLAGCATPQPPLPRAEQVDLEAFMGAWYVTGYTPLVVDKDAYNAVEHYALDKKGRVLTTYQFRKGGFDGPLKTYTPTGYIPDPGNPAQWKMQFVWPFKASYHILYVSDDYQETIIAHPSRKYAWIMQRSPRVDHEVYGGLLQQLADAGYDPSIVQAIPHDWEKEEARLKEIEAVGASRPLAPR